MNVLKSSLLGSLALLGFACSSEEVLPGGPDMPGGEDAKGISIVLHTPSADDVIFKSTRAVDGQGGIQEEQEWAVKKLNLYLFVQDADGGDTDTDYTLYKKTEGITFKVGSPTDGETNVGMDEGNGSYHYTEPITGDMIGKTMKILLVANDKGTGEANTDGTSGTTLAAFKQSLALASVTDGNSADVLVGNPGAEATGFPMSAIAQEQTGSQEAVVMTPMGVDMKAELVRSVARVDLFNYVPNMTITSVVLEKAASKSYLFKQANTAAPGDASYLKLLPTQAWQTDLADGGVPFVKVEHPAKPDEPTEDECRAVNTLKHVLYMYEQVNDAEHCATVKIGYTLTFAGGDKTGIVSVPLKKSDSEFIHPTRNTLYTIKLGDGSIVQDEVKITAIIVEDWVPVDIDDSINPGEDGKVEN